VTQLPPSPHRRTLHAAATDTCNQHRRVHADVIRGLPSLAERLHPPGVHNEPTPDGERELERIVAQGRVNLGRQPARWQPALVDMRCRCGTLLCTVCTFWFPHYTVSKHDNGPATARAPTTWCESRSKSSADQHPAAALTPPPLCKPVAADTCFRHHMNDYAERACVSSVETQDGTFVRRVLTETRRPQLQN
jgi:hypothetical protein